MTKGTILTCFFSFVCGLQAAPVLTIRPSTGDVAGLPGSIVGWGFSLSNDSTVDTLTVDSSFLMGETNAALGTYNDVISFFGGPDNFAVDASSTWTQPFLWNPDPAMQQGIGYFEIAPGALAGNRDSATLVVQYELDNGATGNFDSSGSLDIPISVTVATPASTPEPGTAGMFIGCAGLYVLGRRTRIRR